MSCGVFIKHIQKFGRMISKMAMGKVSNYHTLHNTKNHVSTVFDSEIDIAKGNYYSSDSVTYCNEDLSSTPTPSFICNESWGFGLDIDREFSKLHKDVKLDADIDKDFLKIHEEIDLTQFKSIIPPRDPWLSDNFMDNKKASKVTNPCSKEWKRSDSYESSGFSDNSLFSYSRLSSFESNNSDSAYYDIYNIGFHPLKQQECIKQDFEMNGRTVDIETSQMFQPSVMSTPINERKSNQGKRNMGYNYYFLSQQMYGVTYQAPLPLQENNSFKPKYPTDKFSIKKKPKKVNKKSLEDHCVFCKNNGASEQVYRSHTVKDALGRTLCPKLRLYKCPICGADGDDSHTRKYCPDKPIITMEDTVNLETKKSKKLLK